MKTLELEEFKFIWLASGRATEPPGVSRGGRWEAASPGVAIEL